MKRITSLTITTVLLLGLVVYIIFLMTQSALSVTPDLLGKEMVVGAGLSILLLVTWFYSTWGAHRLNKPKITLSLLGVIIILCGAYLMIDPANSNTFASDSTRIVGVCILIAALAGFIGPMEGSTTSGGSTPHRFKDAEIIEI